MKRSYNMFYLMIFILSIFLSLVFFINKYTMIDNTDFEETYVKDKNKNLAILIEVDRKRLTLIDMKNEDILKTYPIATGKPSSPTPLGTFLITEKAQWGEGFGTRWIGLDVAWGKYGIHGTNQPGTIGANLSAGCIRMRNNDVEELYSLINHYDLVVITNGLYGPFGQGFRELKPGDKGADVLEVQKRLQQEGYYNGNLDGIYGEIMKSSLIKFLKEHNLALTDRVNKEIYNNLGIYLMD